MRFEDMIKMGMVLFAVLIIYKSILGFGISTATELIQMAEPLSEQVKELEDECGKDKADLMQCYDNNIACEERKNDELLNQCRKDLSKKVSAWYMLFMYLTGGITLGFVGFLWGESRAKKKKKK